MQDELTIGKLAQRSGVNVETIRYYQRRGLLNEPVKPIGGYRHYPLDAVNRVRFIKRSQALGFTLEEIAGLLSLDETTDCAETRKLAIDKLTIIDRKLADLKVMRNALAELVTQCETENGKGSCPIIHVLAQD